MRIEFIRQATLSSISCQASIMILGEYCCSLMYAYKVDFTITCDNKIIASSEPAADFVDDHWIVSKFSSNRKMYYNLQCVNRD